VVSPKVRAFVDFLLERLNFDADYMQVLCPDRMRHDKLQREASSAIAADLMRAGSLLEPAPADGIVVTA
jgi:hypothetical protein